MKQAARSFKGPCWHRQWLRQKSNWKRERFWVRRGGHQRFQGLTSQRTWRWTHYSGSHRQKSRRGRAEKRPQLGKLFPSSLKQQCQRLGLWKSLIQGGLRSTWIPPTTPGRRCLSSLTRQYVKNWKYLGILWQSRSWILRMG